MAFFEKREFGLCRALTGHAWDLDNPRAPIRVTENGGRFILLVCTRCAATRKDGISLTTGTVERRVYRYEEGYKIPLGPKGKRVDRSTLRKEVFGMLKEATAQKGTA